MNFIDYSRKKIGDFFPQFLRPKIKALKKDENTPILINAGPRINAEFK